jgi:AcrR family transcriptional regulator
MECSNRSPQCGCRLRTPRLPRIPKAARKDALRNRQAILSAAATLFSENANATYGELAVRSGLNQATVYRHFPDRVSLFAEVFEDTLERFEKMVAGWEPGPDSLERLFRLMAVQQARYRGLALGVRQGDLDPERGESVRTRTRALFHGPLEDAKAAGRVHGHLDDDDVMSVIHMIDGVVAAHATDPEAAAEEAIDLILVGLLKPDGRPKRSRR